MKPASLAVILPSCLGLTGYASHGLAANVCDGVSQPSVSITSAPPASTTATSVNLSGTACSVADIGLASIEWSNDVGATGTTSANTSWDGRWNWSAQNIPLVEGTNEINVTAVDADNRLAVASVTVDQIVEPPPPPPPEPQDGNVIYDQKVKITANHDPAIDRYNAVAYMSMPEDYDLALACDQPITVTVHIGDDETVLFTDTVPAGEASTCYSKKIRAVMGGPDLREVTIQRISPTRATAYIYAHKGTYLVSDPALRDTGFLEYFSGFQAAKLTISMGGQSWSGWTDGYGAESSWDRLSPCADFDETVYSSKVELRCNR